MVLKAILLLALGVAACSDSVAPDPCIVRPSILVTQPDGATTQQLEVVPSNANGYHVVALYAYKTVPGDYPITVYYQPSVPGPANVVVAELTTSTERATILPPGNQLDVPGGIALKWWARPVSGGMVQMLALVCDPS